MTRPATVSNSPFRQLGMEVLIELVDAGAAAYAELPFALATNVLIVLDVELVVDVADDLLDHVFDRNQSGNAAVLIDHDRHVVAAVAEFAQQHIQTLRFRHEHGRPQILAHVECGRHAAGEQPQQIFREQDASDVVTITVQHREARMPRFDHRRQDARDRIFAPQANHLRARDHDVAHLQIRDRECSLEHGKGFRIEHAALLRLGQHLEQLRAILDAGGQRAREARAPAAARAGAAGIAGCALSHRRQCCARPVGRAARLQPACGAMRYGLAMPSRRKVRISRRSMRRAVGGQFMIVACQVQHTVHHHVCPVRPRALVLRARLGAQHSRADHELAEQSADARPHRPVPERTAHWSHGRGLDSVH